MKPPWLELVAVRAPVQEFAEFILQGHVAFQGRQQMNSVMATRRSGLVAVARTLHAEREAAQKHLVSRTALSESP